MALPAPDRRARPAVNEALLELLIAARRSGQLIRHLPPEARPGSLEEAYATADALVAALGGRTAGWKIGANGGRGRAALGLDEPFGGRIRETTLHAPGVRLPVTEGMVVDAEIAFRLGRDIDAEAAREPDRVVACVEAALPVIEINRPSFQDPFGAGGLALVADNGVNAGLVVGRACGDWRSFDLASLEVALKRGDDEPVRGTAHAAGFDPLDALGWLARDRARRGDPLRAGQIVSAGGVLGPFTVEPGAAVEADFGRLGRVAAFFTG